jgi:hypothetical protein
MPDDLYVVILAGRGIAGQSSGSLNTEGVVLSSPVECRRAARCVAAARVVDRRRWTLPAARSCTGRVLTLYMHVQIGLLAGENMHTCMSFMWISSQLALLARGDQPHEVHGHS